MRFDLAEFDRRFNADTMAIPTVEEWKALRRGFEERGALLLALEAMLAWQAEMPSVVTDMARDAIRRAKGEE